MRELIRVVALPLMIVVSICGYASLGLAQLAERSEIIIATPIEEGQFETPQEDQLLWLLEALNLQLEVLNDQGLDIPSHLEGVLSDVCSTTSEPIGLLPPYSSGGCTLRANDRDHPLPWCQPDEKLCSKCKLNIWNIPGQDERYHFCTCSKPVKK